MGSFITLVSGLALATSALVTGMPGPTLPVRATNGLALTPPMGWNSWNRFGCNVSEDLIKGIADGMVSSGMRDAGYQYVTIDDCWQVARDANGTIVADSTRFPHGIKWLADYVHSRGLKFGIYTDAGRRTCQGRPGTYGHEVQDANTYAAWGVDYVKVDWCNAQGIDAPSQYAKIRDAFLHSGRPMVFSICEWGSNRPWEWADTTGNLWRTTGDIWDSYESMLANVDLNMQYSASAGPGHWNDPDMLEVGNGGMTDDEYRAHFSLWAVMAAPLIAGNDIRELTDTSSERVRTIRGILMNREVIAVDQDSLGIQGTVVQNHPPELQVWYKPLRDGSSAVVLFNRASVPTNISANWSRVGIHTRTATVRDLWEHKDLGSFDNHYTAMVPSHGVVMVRITPVR
ncbi:MAG TPA: glycoside hydrolase family 27 protein [Gemmatimonadaceae bacterium]|nr:glycoside hydrolase family 27 protein [Gemmatimonadaceae bacterium]